MAIFTIMDQYGRVIVCFVILQYPLEKLTSLGQLRPESIYIHTLCSIHSINTAEAVSTQAYSAAVDTQSSSAGE